MCLALLASVAASGCSTRRQRAAGQEDRAARTVTDEGFAKPGGQLFPPFEAPSYKKLARESPVRINAPRAYSDLLESICGVTDDSQPVETYNGTLGVSQAFVQAHEQPVGIIRRAGGAAQCTGTLISRSLLLTAGHCFDPPAGQTAAQFATTMTAEFNFQNDPMGIPRSVTNVAINALVEHRVGGVDFAIVQLANNPGTTFGVARMAREDAPRNSSIAIIGHPAGVPKRIEAGTVTVLDANRIGYADLDTLGGNSGSGILADGSGLIVGVHTNGGCTATGGYNSGVPISRLRAVSNQAKVFTSTRFINQTGTALHETPNGFAFMVAGNGDLFAIKKRGTGTGTTEVHVLSRQSNYQSFSLQTGTALHETDDTFEFALGVNRDIYAIKKANTGTKSTEIHVLSASSGYQSFSLQTGTALHETGDNFEFEVAPNGDVFAFKKSATGTGSTEVHVLSRASKYQQFSLQTGTALHETDGTFTFLVDQNRNVWALKLANTDTMSTEIHILDAGRGYSVFSKQIGTVLHEAASGFAFGLYGPKQLLAVKRTGTGTNSTEVHVLQLD